MRFLLLLLVAGFAHAQTPEELAMSRIQKYGPACERAGFPAATEAWGRCIVAAMENDKPTQTGSGLSQGLRGAGAVLNPNVARSLEQERLMQPGGMTCMRNGPYTNCFAY